MVAGRRKTRLWLEVAEAVDQHGGQTALARDLGDEGLQGSISWVLSGEGSHFSPKLEEAMKAAGWDVGPRRRIRMVADVATEEDRDVLHWWVWTEYGLTWTQLVNRMVMKAWALAGQMEANGLGPGLLKKEGDK